MPIKYRVDENKNLVIVMLAGDITSSEIQFFIKQIHPDRITKNVLVWLKDARAELSDIIENASTATDLYGPTGEYRTAIVAPSNLEFGMTRQYLSYRDGSEDSMPVFRNLKDATCWIGLDDEIDIESDLTESDQWMSIGQDPPAKVQNTSSGHNVTTTE